eukprot:3141793-Amphidinium_carterae.1
MHAIFGGALRFSEAQNTVRPQKSHCFIPYAAHGSARRGQCPCSGLLTRRSLPETKTFVFYPTHRRTRNTQPTFAIAVDGFITYTVEAYRPRWTGAPPKHRIRCPLCACATVPTTDSTSR